MHMLRQQPHIVGIVGGSCTGKTWLADNLQKALGESAVRLSLDDFYLDRAHLSEKQRGRVNFDHPRAIDWEQFKAVLQAFATGRSSRVPRYDFTTHRRRSLEGPLKPRKVVIVEGLWLYRKADIRALFSVKVFIRGGEALCEERRLRRDMAERGRTQEQVLEQWREQTVPMCKRFVAPQERFSDLVLNAPVTEGDVGLLLNRVSAGINEGEMVGI